jgi:hypothetical protein
MTTELIYHKVNNMAHYKIKSTINKSGKLFKAGEIIELNENQVKHIKHLLEPIAIEIADDTPKNIKEGQVVPVATVPVITEIPLTQDKTDKAMVTEPSRSIDTVSNPKTKKPS